MGASAGSKIENSLPDWSVVEGEKGERSPPPFFAAEVDELPRQSAIEWHAHLGIVCGRIRIRKSTSELTSGNGWTLYQTIVNGKIMQSLVMVPYSERISDLGGIVAGALESVGSSSGGDSGGEASSELRSHASYIDVSVSDGAAGGAVRRSESGSTLLEMIGVVPCRSLWDEDGRRLAAVVLL